MIVSWSETLCNAIVTQQARGQRALRIACYYNNCTTLLLTKTKERRKVRDEYVELTCRWLSDNRTNYLTLRKWSHRTNEGLFPKRWPEEVPQRTLKTIWATGFIPFPLHLPKCCIYPTWLKGICLSKMLCCFFYIVALYAFGILGLQGKAQCIVYLLWFYLTHCSSHVLLHFFFQG